MYFLEQALCLLRFVNACNTVDFCVKIEYNFYIFVIETENV